MTKTLKLGPVHTWWQRQIRIDDVVEQIGATPIHDDVIQIGAKPIHDDVVEQIGATPIHDDVVKYLICCRRQVWTGPNCKNRRRHLIVRTDP